MEFSGQYLTYNNYRVLGGTLNQMPFNLLEFEARKQIDLRTQKRLNGQSIPNEVKICVFHLINQLENYSKSINNQNGNIASESIDGYSLSYITPTQLKEIVLSKNYEINDTIMSDLYGVIINNEHLIFNGVK